MSPYPHIHLFYTLLAIIFLCVLSFMFFYNARSKARQSALEKQGTPIASKEAGIMEAQESMKHDRQKK